MYYAVNCVGRILLTFYISYTHTIFQNSAISICSALSFGSKGLNENFDVFAFRNDHINSGFIVFLTRTNCGESAYGYDEWLGIEISIGPVCGICRKN